MPMLYKGTIEAGREAGELINQANLEKYGEALKDFLRRFHDDKSRFSEQFYENRDVDITIPGMPERNVDNIVIENLRVRLDPPILNFNWGKTDYVIRGKAAEMIIAGSNKE